MYFEIEFSNFGCGFHFFVGEPYAVRDITLGNELLEDIKDFTQRYNLK